jgi:hypothetical protein
MHKLDLLLLRQFIACYDRTVNSWDSHERNQLYTVEYRQTNLVSMAIRLNDAVKFRCSQADLQKMNRARLYAPGSLSK